jgi:hypothetical protein
MAIRIHRVEQHKLRVPGIEAMTLVSNHHFPRHSHDRFAIGGPRKSKTGGSRNAQSELATRPA